MSNDTCSYTIQVRRHGRITIPRPLREALAIEDGDTLTLLPLGDMLVITPRRLETPTLIDQMADMLDDSGLTLTDLLSDLPQIRESLYQEQYGSGISTDT